MTTNDEEMRNMAKKFQKKPNATFWDALPAGEKIRLKHGIHAEGVRVQNKFIEEKLKKGKS